MTTEDRGGVQPSRLGAGHHRGMDSPPGSGESARPYDPRIEAFEPVSLPRASDETIVALAQVIRSGLFMPGELLPPQRVLAARMQVSLAVLREAMEALRRAGVVSVKRGKSGGVTVRSVAGIPALLASLGRRDPEPLRALLELRRALELTSLPLAATRGDGAAVARLSQLTDALQGLADRPRELLAVDFAFHLTAAQATGNRPLARALGPVLDQLSLELERRPSDQLDARRLAHEQRRLLEAILDKDADQTRQVADRHLATLETSLLGERLGLSS